MKQTKKKKEPRAPDINLDAAQIKGLEGRIRTSNLSGDDQSVLISLIAMVVRLRAMVLKGRVGLLALLRKIFGKKN